jgi:hypothetical protein
MSEGRTGRMGRTGRKEKIVFSIPPSQPFRPLLPTKMGLS